MSLVRIGGWWINPEAVEAIDRAAQPGHWQIATRVHLAGGSDVWFEDQPDVIAGLLAEATRRPEWRGVQSD